MSRPRCLANSWRPGGRTCKSPWRKPNKFSTARTVRWRIPTPTFALLESTQVLHGSRLHSCVYARVCVSCVVCRVSCVVCRVSCVVCRVSCRCRIDFTDIGVLQSLVGSMSAENGWKSADTGATWARCGSSTGWRSRTWRTRPGSSAWSRSRPPLRAASASLKMTPAINRARQTTFQLYGMSRSGKALV